MRRASVSRSWASAASDADWLDRRELAAGGVARSRASSPESARATVAAIAPTARQRTTARRVRGVGLGLHRVQESRAQAGRRCRGVGLGQRFERDVVELAIVDADDVVARMHGIPTNFSRSQHAVADSRPHRAERHPLALGDLTVRQALEVGDSIARRCSAGSSASARLSVR
jgi:hypothetical protein